MELPTQGVRFGTHIGYKGTGIVDYIESVHTNSVTLIAKQINVFEKSVLDFESGTLRVVEYENTNFPQSFPTDFRRYDPSPR